MARHPSSRRRLTTVLVAAGTISVLVLVAVLLGLAQFMLGAAARAQLASARDGRVAAVEHGVAELQADVAAMAADPGVVAAVADLTRTWSSLDQDLTPGEQEAVSELYPSAGQLMSEFAPSTAAGRRGQYLYLATNPFPADERSRLDAADDGSDYSAAHARHHPFLRGLLASTGGSDLLVVPTDARSVVYTVDKHLDFGSDVRGPGSTQPGLATALERLPAIPAGEAVVIDTTRSPLPDAAPTVLVAATVRSGSEVVAALVLAVPVSQLTDLISADGQWDQLGLGTSGDAVIVGADGILRTDPRAWSNDRDDYLARLASRGDAGADTAAEIEGAGSPVGVQDVTDPVVSSALGGDEDLDTTIGPLGRRVRLAAAPVSADGLGWVVVVSHSTSDAAATIGAFLRWVTILLLVLLPLILLTAVIASRALTRPIPSLVAVSSELANGNLDVTIPDLGRNEFGDLARQLGLVARELRHQREAVTMEESRIQGILSAVVPARLMERVRDGDHDFSDVLETATVVSVSLVGLPDPSGSDQDTVLAATTRITGALEDLAARSGLEVVRAAVRQESFLAGLGSPDPDVEAAMAFAAQVPGVVREAGRDFGLDVDASVGMSAGTVGTGLIGRHQLSFGVWGDPPGRAAALDGLARPGEVLLDASVAADLDERWTIETAQDLVALDDDLAVHRLVDPAEAPR